MIDFLVNFVRMIDFRGMIDFLVNFVRMIDFRGMIDFLIINPFLVVNAFLRLLLTLFCMTFVHNFRDTINVTERVGLGITAGGSLLTIGLIADPKGPMEGWSSTVLTSGILIFLVGLRIRYMRHSARNAAASEHARRYLEARGKL